MRRLKYVSARRSRVFLLARNVRRNALLAWLLVCTATLAHADGGRLLLRRQAGPFVLSLFSVPESIGVGDVDLSAMVEEAESGQVLLNPDILLTLAPPDGGTPFAVHLSHAHATNRVLQDAVVRLQQPGRWKVSISVADSGRHGSTSFVLLAENHSAERSTIWMFALLPVIGVLLFLWVQRAKHLRGRALRSEG